MLDRERGAENVARLDDLVPSENVALAARAGSDAMDIDVPQEAPEDAKLPHSIWIPVRDLTTSRVAFLISPVRLNFRFLLSDIQFSTRLRLPGQAKPFCPTDSIAGGILADEMVHSFSLNSFCANSRVWGKPLNLSLW